MFISKFFLIVLCWFKLSSFLLASGTELEESLKRTRPFYILCVDVGGTKTAVSLLHVFDKKLMSLTYDETDTTTELVLPASNITFAGSGGLGTLFAKIFENVKFIKKMEKDILSEKF